MIMTDIRELKSQLQIDPANTQEDKNILFFIEQASNLIEEHLGRDFTYKSRTIFRRGTGTQKLLLPHRPVYPFPTGNYAALQVIEDTQGYYGSASGSFQPPTAPPLVYGQDYALQIDQDDGSSRSAILIRINEYWHKPTVRQHGLLSPFISFDTGSYQVTYTAGFTVDNQPALMRLACNQLVAAIRYMWPLGVPLASENYEDRGISQALGQNRDVLLGLTKVIMSSYRNWSF